MIEFYGTVSDTIARGIERLRRRYYALWLAALALLTAAVAVVAGIQSGVRGFLLPLISAAVLAVARRRAVFFSPSKRQRGSWSCASFVDADAGKLTVVQYLPGREIKKERPLARVRRVYKSKFCYLLVFSDVGSAVVCERSLLKRGTFDLFEFVFSQKLKEKELFSAEKNFCVDAVARKSKKSPERGTFLLLCPGIAVPVRAAPRFKRAALSLRGCARRGRGCRPARG